MEEERKSYNTTLRIDLIKKLRILAAVLGKRQNDLIEEAIKDILEESKLSISPYQLNVTDGSAKEERKGYNTTLRTDIMKKLRILAIQIDVRQNDLIEEAVNKLLGKYSFK